MLYWNYIELNHSHCSTLACYWDCCYQHRPGLLRYCTTIPSFQASSSCSSHLDNDRGSLPPPLSFNASVLASISFFAFSSWRQVRRPFLLRPLWRQYSFLTYRYYISLL